MTNVASFLGSIHEDIRFELDVATFDGELRVQSFAGRERLSDPFRYEITVLMRPHDVPKLKKCLRLETRFSITREGEVEHVVDGVLTTLLEDGTFAGDDQ